MKRLLLISMLLLSSNLGAYIVRNQDNPKSYQDYSSYIAAVDKGRFDPYGKIVDSDGTYGGTSGLLYDGLSIVEKKEGENSPRAQKIRGKRTSGV